jgi:hypothetical protein
MWNPGKPRINMPKFRGILNSVDTHLDKAENAIQRRDLTAANNWIVKADQALAKADDYSSKSSYTDSERRSIGTLSNWAAERAEALDEWLSAEEETLTLMEKALSKKRRPKKR